ncbi:galactose oxidase-like domain-containing protein [Peribacillus butanolivorans]|uniref:galactose oxidase-like domain-containing protein n=1 Tax=Peribacillus butanolivorans TaxID=421767 RepID=UPI00382C697D
MVWSTPISSGDVVAIHAALVPTENGDGEIILFGGDNHDLAAARAHQFNHSARFNCRHPNQALIPVLSPTFDLFCCGHAFLADGRLMVAGGTAEFPPDAGGIHHERHFDGHRHSVAYQPASGTFSNLADMGPEPGHGTRGGGRWYPTLCTLATGEVYAFQGHPLGTDSRHGNNTPERYQPEINNWVSLPAIGNVASDPILYPRLHLVNDGRLFVTSRINGYGKNILIDPGTSLVQEVCPLPDGDYHNFDSPSVLLPLVPEDGYRARFVLCGGSRSQFLDLGNAGAGWQTVPRNGATANLGRGHSNATLLPTGDVLLTGGTVANMNDQTGVMQPEIYSTPLNRATRTYSSGVGQWETINESATVLRNYHSSALLMPDGRVWTAGGNSAQQPGVPPTVNQKKIEIYDPPYPAGTRPTITSGPSIVGYRDDFTIRSPQADTIGSVVLMRCGSSTHAFNSDQRAVYLRFRLSGRDLLIITAPPNGNVAPPGPYMLFIVDRDGRPCQYARFVYLRDIVDDGSRYAAIWEKSEGVPFVARHNLTSSQYQQQFDQLVGQEGYTLTLVNGYTVSGQNRFCAIWEKKQSPPFVARHGLDSQAYQQEFDELVRQGYRLKMVSGYELNGQDHYAAIWEKSEGPAWVARHGLTAQQYQQQFDQLVGQGFRLKLVNGYSVGEQDRYAAIWVNDGGPAFIARHGLTSQEYQTAFDTFVGQQGYRLTWVSCYRLGGEERYAAIWEQSPSPAWVARHGMSSPSYQHEFNHQVSVEGYRLIHVSGC